MVKIVFTPIWRWLTTMISRALIVIYWINVKLSNMYILWKRNIFLTGIIPFNIHKTLTFGYKIKTNYSPSAHLDLTRKNPSRKTLVKLRISSHKLRIETGRYDNIPLNDGLCTFSNCNRIEDETQFLLDCPSFSSIREMFFCKLKPKIPFLRLQSDETL